MINELNAKRLKLVQLIGAGIFVAGLGLYLTGLAPTRHDQNPIALCVYGGGALATIGFAVAAVGASIAWWREE